MHRRQQSLTCLLLMSVLLLCQVVSCMQWSEAPSNTGHHAMAMDDSALSAMVCEPQMGECAPETPLWQASADSGFAKLFILFFLPLLALFTLARTRPRWRRLSLSHWLPSYPRLHVQHGVYLN